MRLFGISNHGLLAIAVLVAILWGCIFAERAIIRQAREETLMFLRSRGATPVKQEMRRRPPSTPVASRLAVPAVLVQADLEV